MIIHDHSPSARHVPMEVSVYRRPPGAVCFLATAPTKKLKIKLKFIPTSTLLLMVKAQPSTPSKMPRFAPALLALLLLTSGLVSAGPWEEGYAAYQRKDYTAAVAKWRQVADKGNAKAQSLMGQMYFFGQGVKQDYPQAITWLNLAAAQGELKAHFRLGSMHENAQGFTQNKLMAAVYYTMAAELAHPDASEALLRVSAELSPKETAMVSRLAQTCIKRAYKACESVLNP